MDKHELLKTKFVELGTKVPVLRSKLNDSKLNKDQAEYMYSVTTLSSFKEMIVKNFDSDRTANQNVESVYSYALDGLPFMIVKKKITKYLPYEESRVVTLIHKGFREDVQREVTTTSCKDAQVTMPTLLGPLLDKAKEVAKIINEEAPYIETRTLDKYGKNRVSEILTGNINSELCTRKDNTWTYKPTTCERRFTISFYILQYKDIFTLITIDEKRQLILDIEKARESEVLLELNTLDVSNISENLKKYNVDKSNDIKPWLQGELNRLEDRVISQIRHCDSDRGSSWPF